MGIPTPHICAAYGDFAKTVLMPGDPKRAQFIAERYLEDARLVTDVRGMLGFTGTYKGHRVSVMGSGMGVPSIGIYAYELYRFYGVENIIRIGTCGAASDDLQLFDIIASVGASYDTNFAAQYELPGTFSATASYPLLKLADAAAARIGETVRFGPTATCDSFYYERRQIPAWAKMGVLAVEMESAGLYMVAASEGKQALALLSVADSMFLKQTTDSEQREKGQERIIRLALETALDCEPSVHPYLENANHN